MSESHSEILKTIILNLLRQMSFDAEIYERQEEGRTVFNVKTRDAQLLIGQKGANLEALQHAVRLLFRKQTQDDPSRLGQPRVDASLGGRRAEMDRFPFALDIDDYKDKRVLYLKELARKAAHHVRETKKAVSLEPMPPYERRVIHNYLSLYNDLGSESVGVDPGRRLIIRPKVKEKDPDGFDFIENS